MITGIAIILISALDLTDVDDRFYYWLDEWKNNDQNKGDKIWLQGYHLTGRPIKLSCIKNNLSGITYNRITRTLFVITNEPEEIHEINSKGKCLRRIKLKGFKDTEGST